MQVFPLLDSLEIDLNSIGFFVCQSAMSDCLIQQANREASSIFQLLSDGERSSHPVDPLDSMDRKANKGVFTSEGSLRSSSAVNSLDYISKLLIVIIRCFIT